jgi:hypothetical protein
MTRTIAAMLLFAASIVAISSVQAQMSADDVKWINQCIADNKGLTKADVIRKYCMCMNEEMDDNDSRSITQFERANPKARARCDRASGWK